MKVNSTNNHGLSERELEVLQHLADGLTDVKIAIALNISEDTVNSHRRNIKKKLGGGNCAFIIAKAFRAGYLK